MIRPEDVLNVLAKRLENSWAAVACGTSVTWPAKVSIGTPDKQTLEAHWPRYRELAHAWFTWAHAHDVELAVANRTVSFSTQPIPTHVLVPDADGAARLVGGPWPDQLARARRCATLLQDVEHLGDDERVALVRAMGKLSDIDTDLTMRAAAWFATNDARGMTPRQVPVPGLHAKWLNTGQATVARLAGLEDLGLARRHPARVHFTYLDPTYLATGARRHDSATIGDNVTLPYAPRTVVISENKDTALWFPPTPDAVSIEGDGTAVAAIAALDWVRAARYVVYWGDMDLDGLEILNQLRGTGLRVRSILMDVPSYQQWEQFGTNVDRHGRPLRTSARPVPHLTPAEAELYDLLHEPDCPGHRRVEQERIPLSVAAQALAVVSE